MHIKILSKDDTLKIISDKKFILRWKYLAENTSHCTIIQEYGFVVSWYRSYLDKYKPMMVLGYDEQENIIGILPLAVSYDTGYLSHAGEDQAEYHGWICLKKYEEEFLVHALISIKKEYKPGNWKWGWLPSAVDINWFNSDLLKKNNIYINKTIAESPLYNLEDSNKIKKKKSIRNKINQLEREGELKIERIRDRNYTKKLLETIIAQYSFRQLALFNHNPLRNERIIKVCLEQMDLMPENIHFTVLWHGDKLLACNFGLCTANNVILGLISYDPVKGKFSPGYIFLIKLLEYIKDEGYKILDLTPGGDSYKEHFCNTHTDLVKPTICFNKYWQIKDYASTLLRHHIKRHFDTKNIVSMQCSIRKNISLLEKKIFKPKDTESSYYFYRGKPEEIVQHDSVSILHYQQYTDLLLYEQSNGILSPKELAYSAMKKFERGDRLYTMVSGNKLIAFVWLANSGKKHWRPTLKNKINYKKNSLYIYDFYTSDKSRKNDIFQSCIQGVLKEIQNGKISIIYLVKPADIDEAMVNSLGFSQ